MNRWAHGIPGRLIQDSMDRDLTGPEKRALERHLEHCDDCRAYYEFHIWLHDNLSRVPSNVDRSPTDITTIVPMLVGQVRWKRRIRQTMNGIKYAAFVFVALLISFALPRGLFDLDAGPAGQQSGPSPQDTVASATATYAYLSNATSSPSPPPMASPTPIPHLGEALPWEAVVYFQRAKSDFMTQEEFDVSRQRGQYQPLEYVSSPNELSKLAGFEVLNSATPPMGYQFDRAWYDPAGQFASFCYVGPYDNSSRVRLCVTEQIHEFSGNVGRSATVYKTSIADLPAEYISGAGWLATQVDSSGDFEYQWNDRLVPGTTMRYVDGDLYIQITENGGCGPSTCLSLQDLLDFAETLR